MKIELQFPYNTQWKCGYVVTNPEGRRVVILYNSHDDRTSTSYARYLMSCSLERFLEPEEHVDHIDNDKSNDCIDNLQILNLAENNRKSSKGRTMVTRTCPICDSEFTREYRQVSHKNNPTCSRRCGGIKSHS